VSGEDILKIVDLTDFVSKQRIKKLSDDLEIPFERVYPLPNQELAKKIMLDAYDKNME